jgi:5-methylcytosine-specific restriction endonuclease McrA
MTKYSEEELIKEIKRVSREYCNGCVPSCKDIKKYAKISLGTYNRRFSGVTKAREKAEFQKTDLRENKTTFDYNFQYKMLPSTRKNVSKRDDGCCRICSQNNEIEIHHIIPVRYWDVEKEHDEMNHPRNLISLCRSCHNKLEGKFMGRNHDEFERLAKEYLDYDDRDENNEERSIFDY